MIPTGTILAFGGTDAPNGYLLCDGHAVSRVDFDDLFAVIGTAFGAGDGSTTFDLPDLRGRSPIGGNVFDDPPKTVGASDGKDVSDRGTSHRHVLSGETREPSNAYDVEVQSGTGATVSTNDHTHQLTSDSIVSFESANFVAVNFIIKA